MSNILVTVNEQKLHITQAPTIAAQGVNEDYVVFTLDSYWSGFGIVAFFYRKDDPEHVYQAAVNSSTGKALIPHEVCVEDGVICFGIYGVKNSIIYTSEEQRYRIVKGQYVPNASPSEPITPGIYEQILSLVGGLEQEMAEFISTYSGYGHETTLWTGTKGANGDTFSLSDNASNYDYIDVFYTFSGIEDVKTFLASNFAQGAYIRSTNLSDDSTGTSPLMAAELKITPTTSGNDKNYTINSKRWTWSGEASAAGSQVNPDSTNYQAGYIFKVVGRKRESDSEIQNARIGYDGTTYQTAGAAIRGQVSELHSGKQDVLTFDTTPTEDSTNPITSGAVYEIAEEVTSLSGDLSELKNDVNDSHSINLFNPDDPDLLTGKYLDRYGSQQTNSQFSETGYIECANGDTFTFYSSNGYLSSTRPVCFYDSSKTFVSGAELNMPTITVSGSSVKYFRFPLTNTEKPSLMIVKNDTTIHEYVPYEITYGLKSQVKQLEDSVEELSTLPDDVSDLEAIINDDTSINLFNTNDPDLLSGKYLDKNGIEQTNSSFCETGYIACTDGDTFTFYKEGSYLSSTRPVCFYNSDKTFVSGAELNMPTITVSGSSIKYFRFVALNTEKTTLMIVKNDTSIHEYEPYGTNPGLVSRVEALEGSIGEIDEVEERLDVIENLFDAESTTYADGDDPGYYYRIYNDEIQHTAGTGFSCRKINVDISMKSISFEIRQLVPNTKAIYCGFSDVNDDLIIKNEHSVGNQEMTVPDNAKYIYLSYFGSDYNGSYTINGNKVVTDKDLMDMDLVNPYDGLTGVAFGTSLTYRAQTTGGFLQYLPSLSGITFDNQGIGSSEIYGNMLTAIKAYTGYSGKRIALLEGFVNDWYNHRALGEWTDTEETSVCGCVRSAINYMLSQNASLTVFLILDHYGRNYDGADCSSSAVNSDGLTQYEFYSEIEKVANSMGIPVIREYAESQVSENTPQYLMDNIHNNALGAKQSARFIWNKMKQYYPNLIS